MTEREKMKAANEAHCQAMGAWLEWWRELRSPDLSAQDMVALYTDRPVLTDEQEKAVTAFVAWYFRDDVHEEQRYSGVLHVLASYFNIDLKQLDKETQDAIDALLAETNKQT